MGSRNLMPTIQILEVRFEADTYQEAVDMILDGVQADGLEIRPIGVIE